jgi:phage gp16-like protein
MSADFPDRKAMLAKVHLAQKALALDEDGYRAVLVRVTGKDSSGACRRRQLVDLLAEFRRLGWKDAPRPPSGKAHVRKVFAIWGAMCRDGIPAVPNRKGLSAFVQRMAGVDDPEWLTAEQARNVIEALKAWQARSNG